MKSAIIMGATSGMGRGIALGLLEEGYTIGVCGRRKEALDDIKAIAPDRVFSKVIDGQRKKHLHCLCSSLRRWAVWICISIVLAMENRI